MPGGRDVDFKLRKGDQSGKRPVAVTWECRWIAFRYTMLMGTLEASDINCRRHTGPDIFNFNLNCYQVGITFTP